MSSSRPGAADVVGADPAADPLAPASRTSAGEPRSRRSRRRRARRRARRRSGRRRRRRRSRSAPSTPAQRIATSAAPRAASTTRVEVEQRADEHRLAARGRGEEQRGCRWSSSGRGVETSCGLARRTRAASCRSRSPRSGRCAARRRARRRGRRARGHPRSRRRRSTALVARRERLADRRGRPQDVDRRSRRGAASWLERGEADADAHAQSLGELGDERLDALGDRLAG